MKKKNLVFIFADQWRRSAIGYANDDPVQTPNMDSFAKKGVYCTNAISACPLCSPHRASLITGKHPLSTGIFTNCKTGLNMKLSDDEVGLGDVLKQNGYKTGYIGKWHLDNPELNRTNTPESGAKNWDAYTPPGAGRQGFDFWYSYGACDEHLHPHYWHDTPKQIKVNQWSPEHETDVAIDFINKQGYEPFALVLSWNPPHSPYEMVPKKYLDLYSDKDISFRGNVELENICCHTGEEMNFTSKQLMEKTKQYYAAVSGLDDQFGRLLTAIKESGHEDDTCVILSADHGDMMGSHGLMAKHVWYEESIGIPFILAGPDITPGVCDTVIGSADMMPTMLDWLDVPIPNTVEGKSKFTQIREHVKEDSSETFICACPGRDVFLKEFKAAGKNPMDFGWRGIRTQQYTYVIEVGYTPIPCIKRYLYDLKNDPLQENPIIDNDLMGNSIAQQLEEKLIGFLKQQKDNFISHLI